VSRRLYLVSHTSLQIHI